MNLALIGAGRIGSIHAANAAKHPKAKLAWVYDPIHEAAENIAFANNAHVAGSSKEIFSNDDVHGIIIATPASNHLELIAEAVKANKAVLCEKPLATEIEKAEECWAEISDTMPVILVGFNRRFDPSFKEAWDRVQRGDIGKPEQMIIVSRDPEPPSAQYLKGSGGIYFDSMIHDFDMTRYFLGEIATVYATGLDSEGKITDDVNSIFSAVAVLQSKDGAICQITNSRHCAYGYDQRLEVFGRDGLIKVGNKHRTTVSFNNAENTEVMEPVMHFFQQRYTEAYQAELSHFIDCIDRKEMPLVDFQDGLHAMILAKAALESHMKGHALKPYKPKLS